MNVPEVLLKVENLSVEFRTLEETVPAVKSLSIELKRGHTLGIVGESGSGKSVTALSILRLIPTPPGRITEGAIWFHSHQFGLVNLLELDKTSLRKIRGNEVSMIFQEPMTSLNPVYTCGEQVSEVLRLHKKMNRKEAKEKTIALFEEVKLPRPDKIFEAYPHELSGGQKQRVMIAMAMACDPQILIADEPTTALDVTVQKTILELMMSLQQTHHTSIIFITHDLGVIAEIADDVLVMYKGERVEAGDVKSIFMNPQHPYTKGLLACRPPMNKRLRFLPTVSDFLTVSSESERSIHDVLKEAEISVKSYYERIERLQQQKPILRMENLKTYFPIKVGLLRRIEGYVKAVDDVSFEVYPGETLGLVGESGCGKTTLGRTIVRLLEPTDGHIYFHDTDIAYLSPQELKPFKKDIQIIFQDPYGSLNPRMTIGEAIMEPMKVHGLYENDKTRKERAIYLLERVSLKPEHFNRYPHEFSGGQRQRICIARALALNPKFLICDESVSALDVSVQAQVLNLLLELREEFQLTYIFISHDLSVVKFMSDRMIVMRNGKIVEMGPAEDIYRNPQNEYTKTLIDAIPLGNIEDIERAMASRATWREKLTSTRPQ